MRTCTATTGTRSSRAGMTTVPGKHSGTVESSGLFDTLQGYGSHALIRCSITELYVHPQPPNIPALKSDIQFDSCLPSFHAFCMWFRQIFSLLSLGCIVLRYRYTIVIIIEKINKIYLKTFEYI